VRADAHAGNRTGVHAGRGKKGAGGRRRSGGFYLLKFSAVGIGRASRFTASTFHAFPYSRMRAFYTAPP
jgi:hypothetical protein